jgi:hypothetical protein
MSSEVTRHIKEPVQLRGIEFFHTGIKSEGVLGCIGFETGVIKEILDEMPPRVDLTALYEKIIEKDPGLTNNLPTDFPIASNGTTCINH